MAGSARGRDLQGRRARCVPLSRPCPRLMQQGVRGERRLRPSRPAARGILYGRSDHDAQGSCTEPPSSLRHDHPDAATAADALRRPALPLQQAAGVCTRARAGAVSLIAPRPRRQRGWCLHPRAGQQPWFRECREHGIFSAGTGGAVGTALVCSPAALSSSGSRAAPPGPAAQDGGCAESLSSGHHSTDSPCAVP